MSSATNDAGFITASSTAAGYVPYTGACGDLTTSYGVCAGCFIGDGSGLTNLCITDNCQLGNGCAYLQNISGQLLSTATNDANFITRSSLCATGPVTYSTSTGAIGFTNPGYITLSSLSGTAPISYNATTGAVSISQSGSSSNGYLSSTDWNTFNNKMVSPMSNLGDMIYGGASGTPANLPGNTTTVQKFLSQTGDGTNSSAPSWQVIPSQGSLIYYFQNTASSIAGDCQMLTTPYTPKTDLSTSGLGSGSTVLYNWATNAGFPSLSYIPAGQYEFHVHAAQTAGTEVANLYAQFWDVSSTGTDVAEIGQSEDTSVDGGLTGTEEEFELFFTDGNTYTMASTTDRVVARVYACVTGGGSAPTVAVYVGDEADSHISLPSNTVDATSFVPYTGATQALNLGTNNFTTTGALAAGTSTLSNLIVTNNATSTFAGNICSAGNAVASVFYGSGAGLTNLCITNDNQLANGAGYITAASTSAAYVPYTGATGDVCLGVHNLCAACFIGNGAGLTNLCITNDSQLANSCGYLTSFSETDPIFNAWKGGTTLAAAGGAAAGGSNSVAIGATSTASGAGSVALGWCSCTCCNYSDAMGFCTFASGPGAAALGSYASASGLGSTALGDCSIACCSYSTAIGAGANASADSSFAVVTAPTLPAILPSPWAIASVLRAIALPL